jgi:hypothetical protein
MPPRDGPIIEMDQSSDFTMWAAGRDSPTGIAILKRSVTA